jgi:hypothetical protein
MSTPLAQRERESINNPFPERIGPPGRALFFLRSYLISEVLQNEHLKLPNAHFCKKSKPLRHRQRRYFTKWRLAVQSPFCETSVDIIN